jgi:nucleoside-diphosphate-sugar epimerase
MNFLTTGGMGFIGHNVVKLLLDQGHTVYDVDNRTDYDILPRNQLNAVMQLREKKTNSKSIAFNITDTKLIDVAYCRATADTVIHLAGFPRQRAVAINPVYASEVMISGLINLLEHAARHKVKRFVYISSSMVYGDFTSGVTESDTCRPQGQYAILKYAGEQLVKDYSRRTGMEYVIIRPSAVYGEYDVEDRVVSKFIVSALRDETIKVHGSSEVLDFTHVDDTASGIVQAALSTNTAGKIYNITRSDCRQHTLLSAAKLIVDIVGRGNIHVLDRDGNYPSRGNLNIQQAKSDFEFNPQINVEEGFKRYYEWYLQNTSLWHSAPV